MKMIKNFLVAGLGLALLVGCDNIGNAPAGMSNQDAKNAIDRMTPEQKIKAINSSPMPADEKRQRFEEIERETGVKASDVLSGQPQVPGTGSAN